MGRIGCVRCEKIPMWLRATNFCINCTSSPRFAPSFMQLRNNPKCTKILQRSNGVDWVRSLQKIPTSLRGTNFSINCTNSPYFAPSFMQLRNDPKCTQTLWNKPKHEFRIQWGGSGAFVVKITTWLRGTNYCINCTSSVCLQQVSCSYEMIPNASKYYETDRNISLGSH